MRIINEALLATFARPGRCELCGVWCKQREAHHIFSRGAGRLDISINLVSLGSTRLMQCSCHRDAARIGKDAFLRVVAEREELSIDVIVAAIYRLRRLPNPANWPWHRRTRSKKPAARLEWVNKAAELRRAAARAAYRRMKEWREASRRKKGPNGEA